MTDQKAAATTAPTTDFVEDILFNYTNEELKENFLRFVELQRQTFPTMPPEVIETMKKQTSSRQAMQMLMIFDIVMTPHSGITQYAMQRAKPQYRLSFFQQMAKYMLRPFVSPQQAGDSRVPDSTDLMPVIYSEYSAFRDDAGRFRAFCQQEEEKKKKQQQSLTTG